MCSVTDPSLVRLELPITQTPILVKKWWSRSLVWFNSMVRKVQDGTILPLPDGNVPPYDGDEHVWPPIEEEDFGYDSYGD